MSDGSVMFSRADSAGNRLYAWKTNPTLSRRSRVSARSRRPLISVPPIQDRPEVATSRPAMQFIKVDLPEPEGPIIALKEPVGMSRLTPASAVTAASPCPYTFTRSRARAAGGASVVVFSGVSVVVFMLPTLGLRCPGPRRPAVLTSVSILGWSATLRWARQPRLVGVNHELHPIPRADLGQQVVHVGLHR